MILEAPDAPPTHHPSLETLTAYAAGTLRPGFDVVTAVHLHACARCRQDVAALECVGGALLADNEGAALSNDALTRTLARLDEPAIAPPARSLGYLLRGAKRRWVAPGVWVAKIDTPHEKNDRVYMLSAAPGAATAMHTHGGAEFTQVLSGALGDDGAVYRMGDFVERDAEHTHQPHTVGREACVCLFATEGRLTASNWVGRIAFALADV